MMFKINLRKGLNITIIMSLSFPTFSNREISSLLKEMNNSMFLNRYNNEGMVDLKNPEINEKVHNYGSGISTYGWEINCTF